METISAKVGQFAWKVESWNLLAKSRGKVEGNEEIVERPATKVEAIYRKVERRTRKEESQGFNS